MARLPYAGGRNGMGTTAVENDFLNQLEEAHSAGDEMIAATLAGEPTPIRELPAMLVQSSRQEMREGSAQPPQQTVREELAMSALESGLGSRPRSFVPPTSRMSKGGQTPRYQSAGQVPRGPIFVQGASGTIRDEDELLPTNWIEAFTRGITNRRDLEESWRNPPVANAPMSEEERRRLQIVGRDRVSQAQDLPAVVRGGAGIDLAAESPAVRNYIANARVAHSVKDMQDPRGFESLPEELLSKTLDPNFSLLGGGYTSPALLGGGLTPIAPVDVGRTIAAPVVARSLTIAEEAGAPKHRYNTVRSGIGRTLIPLGLDGAGGKPPALEQADNAVAEARVRQVLNRRRENQDASARPPRSTEVNSQIIDTAADLQGGETDLISKQRKYLEDLLNPERRATAKRRDTGALLTAMAGALLTDPADGGGLGAAFKAAGESGIAAQRGRREDEAISAQAGLAMMRDLTTKEMQAKGAEDALALEAARAEDTLALEERRFANTRKNQLDADEFEVALQEMLAGERAGIEASRLAGSFPDLMRARAAMETARREGNMEEQLLYYRVAVLKIEEDEALIDIALKTRGITEKNIDQLGTGEIQDILNEKNEDGVSYIDQIRLQYSHLRPSPGSFGGQLPSMNP